MDTSHTLMLRTNLFMIISLFILTMKKMYSHRQNFAG